MSRRAIARCGWLRPGSDTVVGWRYSLAKLTRFWGVNGGANEAADCPAAAASLDRALALCGEAGDLPGQGYMLTQLRTQAEGEACYGEQPDLFGRSVGRSARGAQIVQFGVAVSFTGEVARARGRG
jgi:hypothetical protein